jgi:hypothetical protein
MPYYSFSASGTTSDGNKIKAYGYVQGPEGYPQEVFDAAKNEVVRLFPGIVLNGETEVMKTFPALKLLKRKSR